MVKPSNAIPNPHVAVVVVARDRVDDTLASLQSVVQSKWNRLTVILVDNSSSECLSDIVQPAIPSVDVVRLEENRGYAGGNNVGIERALALGADFVFLLNNDATIADGTIAACIQTAQGLPDAGAVCPVIYFADPPNMIWYAGAIFDASRAHSGRMLAYREFDGPDETIETGRATGAAVLIPRASLETVGYFDDDLFFLYEDVDWSLRARGAGYKIYVEPAAKAWHRVSATAGGEHSPFIAYYDTRNHVIVCRRHAKLAIGATTIRDLGILAVHAAGARRARYPARYLRAALRGWIDGLRGRTGSRATY
jgi:GT2 family glycosyltransferase